jgi:hypothetical protein
MRGSLRTTNNSKEVQLHPGRGVNTKDTKGERGFGIEGFGFEN